MANDQVTDDLVEKKLITKHGTYAGGKVNPARLNSGFHNCKLFLQHFFKTSHAFLSTEYEIFQFQILNK